MTRPLSPAEREEQAVEVLTKARALIEKGWTQGAAFRDATGRPCFDKDAASCCADGAVAIAAPDGTGLYMIVTRLLTLACLGDHVAFNDKPGRTKEEVLAAFDRAIALARGEVQS